MRPFDSSIFPSVIAHVPDDGFAWAINNNNYTTNMFGGGTFHNLGNVTIGNNQIIIQGQTGEWMGFNFTSNEFCGNTYYTITMDFTYTITGTRVNYVFQRPVLRRIGYARRGTAIRNENWSIYLNGQSYLTYNAANATVGLTPNATLPNTSIQTFTLNRGQFRDINLAHFINVPTGNLGYQWRDEWNVTMRVTNSTANQPGVADNTPFITHKDVHLRKGTLFGGVNTWGSGQQGHFDIYWGLTPATMTNHIRIPATGDQSSPSIPDTILLGLTPRTDYWYYAIATNTIGFTVRTPNQMFKTWHNPGKIWNGLSWRSLNNKRCHIFTGDDGTPAGTEDPAAWVEMGTFDGPPKSEKGWYGPPEQTTPEIPTIRVDNTTVRNRKYYEDVPSLDTPVLTVVTDGDDATISWSAISEATSYDVIVNGPNGFNHNISTTNLTYTLTGLENGDYQVLVRATNAQSVSEFAEESFEIVPGALGSPSNLALTSTPYTLSASWTAGDNADFYTITVTNGTITQTSEVFDLSFDYQYPHDALGDTWTVTVVANQFTGAVSSSITDDITAPLPLPAPASAVVVGGTGNATINSITAVTGAVSYIVAFDFQDPDGNITTNVAVDSLSNLPQIAPFEIGFYIPTVYAVDQYGTLGIGLVLPQIEVTFDGFIIKFVSGQASGSRYFSNVWTTPIIIKDVRKGVTVQVAANSQYTINESQVGDTFLISESIPNETFRSWSTNSLTFITLLSAPADGPKFHILQAPDLNRFTVDSSGTIAAPYMLRNFCSGNAIESIPFNMVDTSSLTHLGVYAFKGFIGNNKSMQQLPAGSFNLDNVQTTESRPFDTFAAYAGMQQLPAGSFSFSSLQSTTGYGFCADFNSGGGLTSLPIGSFNIPANAIVADGYFYGFNNGGALTIGNGQVGITAHYRQITSFSSGSSDLPATIPLGTTVYINGS